MTYMTCVCVHTGLQSECLDSSVFLSVGLPPPQGPTILSTVFVKYCDSRQSLGHSHVLSEACDPTWPFWGSGCISPKAVHGIAAAHCDSGRTGYGTPLGGECVSARRPHLDDSLSLYLQNKGLALMASVGILVLAFFEFPPREIPDGSEQVRQGGIYQLISASPRVEVGGFLEPRSSEAAQHT